MYLLHHHNYHHHYHYHHHRHHQQQHHHHHLHHFHHHRYQRATQEEDKLIPETTFDLTLICVVMFLFRYVVMFYVNRLISAWNNRNSNHTNLLTKITGLDPSVIASLPVFTHSHTSKREPEAAIQCVVCLSTVEDGELVKLLPNCMHLFHVECIDTWLRLHSACPVCRGSINPKEERTKN